jgi:hypothetical protein
MAMPTAAREKTWARRPVAATASWVDREEDIFEQSLERDTTKVKRRFREKDV